MNSYNLEQAVRKLANDRDINLTNIEMVNILNYIDNISKYLGQRAYHLMTHCNRKSINLRDIKNASRIEIKENIIENLVKYSNYIVTRYFEIRKGYSLEILNEVFNYGRLCPSKILLELEIYFPFNYFRDHLKLLNTYQVKYESTIFLIALVQSITINILNSLKGIRKVNSSIKIEDILKNYKCHSDYFNEKQIH